MPLPATLRRFGVSQKKSAGNFLEAATRCIPGPDGIFQQTPSPPRGDRLPERSSRTLAVEDSSFPRAGMSGRRRQRGRRLGKGTACTSELIWDGWMRLREEEAVKSCGNNRVNNHLQREHGEPGTRRRRATKAIHQQELSLGRTPMAQGRLDRIGADAKPVTCPPGLLERERLGGSQAGKPESSTSHGRDATLKMLLGNEVVAAKP